MPKSRFDKVPGIQLIIWQIELEIREKPSWHLIIQDSCVTKKIKYAYFSLDIIDSVSTVCIAEYWAHELA